MSSENEDNASQWRDFHPSRTPNRATNAPPTLAPSNPASWRPCQPATGAPSNRGPSRPSQTPSHGESGPNAYRSRIRSLELQVQDLREQNSLLKSLLQRNVFDEPKPDVARWELVKTHMRAIAKRLMLGLDPKKNRPFPREEHIKEAIFEAFNTSVTDTMTRKVFDRVWVETLRKKVRKQITNRRGRFSTTTRTQLWRFLGVPKPQQGTQEEIEEWKQILVPFAEENRWRWNDDDPFGSDAVCNTIAFVKFGKRFSQEEPLRLTAKQLAWFAYVMHLAMDGDRNMKESEMRLHKKEIKGMKKFVLENQHLLKKIEIIVSVDGDTLQEVLGEDLDED